MTACILCGASADRMKFISMITFVALWHVLVYCPIAYSNWNQSGFLHSVGVLDWAGGNVVHVAAGMSGLVTSLVIGKRRGYGEQPFTPINMLHTIAGACFLWVGWFGFNGGSSFRADEGASRALFMTQVATSAAAFSWILMERVTTNRPTVLGMLNGAVAGLVAITPSAGYVDSTGAFFIGLISGPVCYYGTTVKKKLGLDDALDAFGLHGIAGFYGVLMTGLFANSGGATGAFYGNSRQLALQLYGVICTVAWSLSATYCILIAVNVTMGLRVSVTAEESGLDRSSHGEGLYVERSKVSSTAKQLAQLIESCAAAVHKPTVSSRDSRAVGGEGGGGVGVVVRVGIGEGGGGGAKAGGGVGKGGGNGGSGGSGGGEGGEKERGGGGGGDGGSVGMGLKEMEWIGGIDEIPHTARRKPFPREKRRAEEISTSTKRVTLLPIPRTRSKQSNEFTDDVRTIQ